MKSRFGMVALLCVIKEGRWRLNLYYYPVFKLISGLKKTHVSVLSGFNMFSFLIDWHKLKFKKSN